MGWFWKHEEQDSFFQRLYEAYFGAAYRAAWMITRDAYLAEDAAQEAFCYIAKRLKEARSVDNPGAWIVSLATRRAIDEVRKQNKRPAPHPNETLDRLSGCLPNQSSTPEDAALRAEESNNLRRLIKQLRPEFRQVITLFYYHHKSEAEIGKLLNVPIGTVKTWLRRGRAELVKAFHSAQSANSMKGGDFHAAK